MAADGTQAGHDLRRLGLHRTPCRQGAGEARLAYPRRVRRPDRRRPSAAARRRRPDHAGAGQSARPLVGRSRRRGRRCRRQPRRAASCMRAAARPSAPCKASAPARWRKRRAAPASATLVRDVGDRRRDEGRFGLCKSKAEGEAAALETVPGADGDPAVDRVRPRGPVLQPLRGSLALPAFPALIGGGTTKFQPACSSAMSPRRSRAPSTARSPAARPTSSAARR